MPESTGEFLPTFCQHFCHFKRHDDAIYVEISANTSAKIIISDWLTIQEAYQFFGVVVRDSCLEMYLDRIGLRRYDTETSTGSGTLKCFPLERPLLHSFTVQKIYESYVVAYGT